MGTALAIVALFLSALLFPLGLLLTFFVNLYKRRWSFSFKRLDQQFLSIATSIDASGNVVCKDLFKLYLKSRYIVYRLLLCLLKKKEISF